MENDGPSDSVREQMHEIERGEMVPWVMYPPTPAWWAVGFGVWAVVLTLAIGLLEDTALALTQLALIVVMFLAIAWDRRRRGTYPSGLPPRAFHSVILRMVLGAAVVAAAAWLVGDQVSLWLAAAIAGVGAWTVVAWYEHDYAAVAERIRERLQ